VAKGLHGADDGERDLDLGANDALRTGTYSKTLTFTLSATNP
jgi:hypothetical protein